MPIAKKPACLQKGDQVAIISTSAPLLGLLPHRRDQGFEALRNLGFDPILANHALAINGHTAGSGLERATDMNALFGDTSVKAIISAIGGDHANQMLPYLDWGVIEKNPKVLVGFSDTTVLLLAIYQQTSLITFYGPSLLNQFAEYPSMHEYTKKAFLRAVATDKPIGTVKPSPTYTDEFLDWFEKKDRARPREMRPNTGWQWLKEGKAKGRLIGGCITSLLHLAGTPYWPEFDGALLFWEIPEGDDDFAHGKDLSQIDSCLADLENIGTLQKISGMIIGRPYGYSEEETNTLYTLIQERLAKYNYPVLAHVDFGHTDPILTIPIGAEAELDSGNNDRKFTILSHATEL